ncbi:hypothetical protein AB0I39_07595 [Kitasatospora purpeofusca]|uniref:hypothetical protein n=1 Tax=Kitasatospora purpeofusca TaxID=67352 RepID=UPI0034023697
MDRAADPATTALFDQVDASRLHTEALLAADGRRLTGTVSTDQAPPWLAAARAAHVGAGRDGTLRTCAHTTGIQPAAVLAEIPDRIVCWDCYKAAQAHRTCLACGRPAGSTSLLGGVEDARIGLATLYSRVLCTPCADPTTPAGTFGNGN